MRIFQIKQMSGDNSLEMLDIPTPDPKPDEVLIRHEAIGVNFMDYEYLRGSIKSSTNPVIPGIEAVGIIEKLGKDVKNYQKGQRVGYATLLNGAYCEYRCLKPRFLFPIHDSIEPEAAALNMLKGMSAHFLMRRTFYLRENMIILIHGGASNLGKLMIRYARELNVKIIASVGSHEKKQILDDLGVDLALNYNDDNSSGA
jgi:NADPH2:quinone reductase